MSGVKKAAEFTAQLQQLALLGRDLHAGVAVRRRRLAHKRVGHVQQVIDAQQQFRERRPEQ